MASSAALHHRALHVMSASCQGAARRSRRAQRGIIVRSASEDRQDHTPLFQLDTRHSLTMADVRDAYEVCSLIPDPNERNQCYSVFGLDAKRMANYYETVVQLEDQLSADFHSSNAPGVVLTEDDPDDYQQAPAECSFME